MGFQAAVQDGVAGEQKETGEGSAQHRLGGFATGLGRPILKIAAREKRQVEFIERAGERHPLQRGGRPAAVGREARREFGRPHAAHTRHPERLGEVMKGHDRRDAEFVAEADASRIVVERGVGDLAGRRLDPRPFDRKAVGVQAQVSQQAQILAEPPEVIGGVTRRLPEQRGVCVLERPAIGKPVVAFDLVGGGGGAPQEMVREAGAAHLRNRGEAKLKI